MKSTKQKKLQLGKIKIADLSKAKVKEADICLTSLNYLRRIFA